MTTQSPPRTPSKDIELRVQVDKQPESVRDMTKNPASANDAMRLRGGGCCVRYSRGVSILFIYAYSRNFVANCAFVAKSYAASSAVEGDEETIVFLI
jgi:hypothetical protein